MPTAPQPRFRRSDPRVTRPARHGGSGCDIASGTGTSHGTLLRPIVLASVVVLAAALLVLGGVGGSPASAAATAPAAAQCNPSAFPTGAGWKRPARSTS